MTSRVWPLLVCCVVVGCSSYDAPLNRPIDNGEAGTGPDGGGSMAGTGGAGSGGAGGQGGEGGAAGMAGGGGVGGTGGGSPDCFPNPNTLDEVCPLVCPEQCNGLDDDCDTSIDEEPTTLCDLPNAESLCTDQATCVVTKCTGTFRDCDDMPITGCETPQDDVNHCGTCGKKCSVAHGSVACVDKLCTQTGCDDGYADCDANENDCETQTNTLTNCAGCGLVCENVPNAVASCELGYCGPGQCDSGFGDCNTVPGDGCEQPLNTLEHCGACNDACAFAGSMTECLTGVCRATTCDTGAGYADCDQIAENGCESLNTAARCGACDKICDTSLSHVTAATCANPTCNITCESGWGDCDGDPQTGCETQLNSLTHCGACNAACAFANAVADCSTGTCTLETCTGGFDDCTGGEADGCETPLTTDSNCGACGTVCTGGKTCSGGICSAVDCSMPPHDTVDCSGTKCGNCDSNDADCEVDLAADLNNCGTCGNKCEFTTGGAAATATLGCSAQGCKAVCQPGYGDCNGDYHDGCEQLLNTLSNCDACGQACAIANASEKCTTWSAGHYLCEVDSCATDFADCDTDKASCESALNTVAHCGTCPNACSLPNANPACTGGTGNWACSVSSCSQTYYRNCNNLPGDGCEIDVRSNVAHCGACANDCRTHANVGSATCSSSSCNYTCSTGYASCNVTPGCETNIRTLTDCGGCGVACSRANGTASCSTGSCTLTGCNLGYADCDSTPGNGCEPLNTVQNCGLCGVPCNLANATSTCSTGTCAISSCNANWADCDGSASNGCERDTRSPAMGGLGPCVPDTNCTKLGYGGHEYFFCQTLRAWTDARSRCQSQLSGDLVHVDNLAENDFIRVNTGGDAWIGATDAAVEGAWRWVDSNQQFWQGVGGTGSVVGGLFNRWATNEPNDSGGMQDCGVIWQTPGTGTWDDENCTATRRFVCEVPGDLCPSDPAKTNPQQCGCGNPDVDADGDGTASCAGQNDLCDNDPAKVAPGQCGCGVSDVDGDGDTVANCVDACPTDPAKSASAGQCGCGVAEGDTDMDGTADCLDACKYDAARSATPCSLSFTPSNVTAPNLFTGAPDVVAGCGGTLSFSTSSATAVTICGTSITPIVQAQAGGPELWILPMNSLSLASGTTLRFTGTRPVVLAVANDATIDGTVDAGAQGTTPGAGGDVSCAVGTGQGADGVRDADADDGDGGGGGGGFGSAGAVGGAGNAGGGGGGAGGAVVSTLVPLRGGCRGGAVQTGGNVNGAGAGGGAVQILVGGRLTLGATAVVAAAGGGGNKGTAQEDGGGGGGSGGAVFREALQLSVNASAWVTANGGGGAGGTATNNTNGSPGTDGLKTNTSRAPGGAGGNANDSADSDGGGGGQGAALAGAATAGANAGPNACKSWLIVCLSYGDEGGGGGGGGGGAGRVRIRGAQAGCSVPTARISPAATIACP